MDVLLTCNKRPISRVRALSTAGAASKASSVPCIDAGSCLLREWAAGLYHSRVMTAAFTVAALETSDGGGGGTSVRSKQQLPLPSFNGFAGI